MTMTSSAAAADAAVSVAAGFGITGTEPVILADGANVIIHLSPSPVVAGTALPDEATIGTMLRDLHAVLRGYPGAVPVLVSLRDIPAFLARPQTRLSDRDEAALASAFTRLTAELDAASYTGQVLHGDAGAGNLMATGAGWVWHDFEDACSGPAAWDLAPSAASARLDGARVLAAYGRRSRRCCPPVRWLCRRPRVTAAASSAMSRSPNRLVRAATTRAHSSWWTRVTASSTSLTGTAAPRSSDRRPSTPRRRA
jgi:aminoglycoside phosphotransferase (APT) family kinase protein